MSDCCEESYNPKKRKRLKARHGLRDITDPIKREIKDLDRVRYAYAVYPIVPFFDGGDATLSFFRMMREYSPTRQGCITSINTYATGGMFTVVKKRPPGFKDLEEDNSVSDEDQRLVIDYIESLSPEENYGGVLHAESEKFADNWASLGNGFYKCTRWKVAGQPYFSVENVDAEKCRYVPTEKNEPRIIMISPLWTADYVSQYPPEFINQYPFWSDYGDYEVTMIHRTNPSMNRDWYGLPSDTGSLYYQYMEVQLGQYGSTGYANRWTAQKFFESEGNLEDEDFDDEFFAAIQALYTNKGAAANFIYKIRPQGVGETKVHEFKDDKSHEFHEGMASISENQIIKSWHWHKVLMGVPIPGKLGGDNEFATIFKVKYPTIIRPWQLKLIDPINIALMEAAKWTGDEGLFDDLSLDYANLFADVLTISDESNVQITEIEE